MRAERRWAHGRDEPPSDAAPPDESPARRPGPRRDLRTWETLVERRIREAMESGEFDELPFRGERLPPDDDGAWGIAGRLLRRAGAAPPWIESDKAVRALLEERDAILRRAPWSSPLGRRRDRAAIVRIVREIDILALRLEQEAPTPAQHRRRLDLAEELERWESAADGRPTSLGRSKPS